MCRCVCVGVHILLEILYSILRPHCMWKMGAVEISLIIMIIRVQSTVIRHTRAIQLLESQVKVPFTDRDTRRNVEGGPIQTKTNKKEKWTQSRKHKSGRISGSKPCTHSYILTYS